MPTLDLIYFAGCPNVQATRESIKTACVLEGLALDWQEWEQSDPKTPSQFKGYGSPTVLVNGKDIFCEKADNAAEKTQNCRIYQGMTGVPSAELIQKALREYT